MVYRKLYMDKIKNFIEKDFIKIITDVRRSGKSYLLKLLIKELKKEELMIQIFIDRFRITKIQSY